MQSSGEDNDPAVVAARNNAELCDAVCRAHGLVGSYSADMWSSPRRTPELYPDAVTLGSSVDPSELLARIDCSTGVSVKDSFATLDLSPYGLRILFEAEWIRREAGSQPGGHDRASGIRWSRVDTADALSAWEAAWSDDGTATGRFPPGLLDEDELVVLQGAVAGTISAGVIVNGSGAVVGISNFFAEPARVASAWTSCLDELATTFPDRAIVGYESGSRLDAAHASGFRSVGPLRVWIDDR